jgi:exosortase
MGLAAAAAALWAYWTPLSEAAQRWGKDPQYSHGYLVPVFAAVLLWLRRQYSPTDWPSWSVWGVLVLACGLGLRLFGVYFHFVWLDPISLLPCLAGLCLLLGGLPALRWAGPSIAYLAFMIPLPHSAAVAMSSQLQRVATIASTFLLQTLGLPALAEGNTILLDEIEIGVVEACSGLRMLVIFFALAVGVALVVRRRLWEKVVLVASAVPIALASNVLRITTTGVLHQTVSGEAANAFFHDLAGWLMMPLALAMLWLELWVLDRLFLTPTASRTPPPVVPPRPTRPTTPSRVHAVPSRTARTPVHAGLRPAVER